MADPIKRDVIIVGAGPSGSRLAFKLAGMGYRVLVLDKKAAAGENICCTGIVSRRCLEAFEIERELAYRSASSARLVAPSGQSVRFWRDDEVAFILNRPAFDRALADRARAAGAEFWFDRNVADITIGDDAVRVKTVDRRSGEALSAAAVVLATGFGSPLPGRLGLGKIDDVVIGAQAQVDGVTVDEVELYFDRDLAPGGFAWLVPTAAGRGLAGLLTRRQPQAYLERLLARLEAAGKIAAKEVTADYAVIPLRPLPRTSTERLLVLGEAAGQIKPTTAGGIYYGLLGADIAAATLDAAFRKSDFSRAGLCGYERRWRQELGREIKTGRRLLGLYRSLRHWQLEGLFRLARRRRLPDFIAGLEELPFDRHGFIAWKMVKYLAKPGVDSYWNK